MHKESVCKNFKTKNVLKNKQKCKKTIKTGTACKKKLVASDCRYIEARSFVTKTLFSHKTPHKTIKFIFTLEMGA